MSDGGSYMYRSAYDPEALRTNSRDFERTGFRTGEGPAKIRVIHAPIWACNTYQAIFCLLFLILSGLLGLVAAKLAGAQGLGFLPGGDTRKFEHDQVPNQVEFSNDGYVNVPIGASPESKKCITAPRSNIFCGKVVQEEAPQAAYYQGSSVVPAVPLQWQISHEGDSICAQRIGGWDVNLVLRCQSVQGNNPGASPPVNAGQTVHDKSTNAQDTAFQQTGGKVDGADIAYVTIGNTVGTKSSTKCVPEPAGVVCDNSAQQVGRTGKYDDTFNIYREAGKVCAHRTDAKSEWGLNLVLKCKKSTQPVVNDKYTMVQIGASVAKDSSTKCVEAPKDVHCDDHAEQVGRTGKYSDKFHIYHDGDKICAKRTDHDAAWGLNLVLKCTNLEHATKFQDVTIGQSLHDHVKCVDDPGNVHCDNTAQQIGRTGKYPDTFDIFHKGNKICAKRTDHSDPWGLELILKCKSTVQ